MLISRFESVTKADFPVPSTLKPEPIMHQYRSLLKILHQYRLLLKIFHQSWLFLRITRIRIVRGNIIILGTTHTYKMLREKDLLIYVVSRTLTFCTPVVDTGGSLQVWLHWLLRILTTIIC